MTKFGDKLELAKYLEISRRHVDRLVDDGVLIADPDDRFDLERNQRRHDAFKNHDIAFVDFELRASVEALTEGMRELRGISNISKRRKTAERLKVGHNIGRLDAAFQLGNAMASEGHRPLLRDYCGRVVGEAVGEYFDLLGIEMQAEHDTPAPRKRGRRARRVAA